MIIWALFDSGNGSYTKVAKNMPGVEIYPIGLDIENKNDHFINLDLSDYSYLFGYNTRSNIPSDLVKEMFDKVSKEMIT